jgi:glycosyltransferase involved in cell wall biosynthesis
MLDIWNPHAFIGISDILRKVKPDIVHTHNLNGLSLGSVSSVLSLGLPLVHTCHDFSLLCPFATLSCPFRDSGTCIKPSHLCKIYRILKKMFMDGKPDIVIFPSRATQRIYLDNRFFLKTKKQILYYCIPELPLQKAQKEKENGHFNLLYVGQLVQHKGVHILIEAFKSISDPNLRLDIVGEGGYKRYLQELAGNDPRIIFHGQIPVSSIRPYYENADITIVPSLWQEVLGIVILESFSASTPVIASNIGGISEIVKPGHNGFLFEPSDAKGLAVILERVIRNPELLKKISFNARESAGEFTVGEHVGKLLELYKEAQEISR